ncbi:ATP-binding protein [Shewanella olleyana]|uniref:ATP-binding protein n=1 Tax=Shewanella olleyana TaxID=135626 RepID=UPI00200FD065|nr:ATP-binding protein [Shewanella olleyana]MCL1066439.1 ATP-binding protein [Shewanella olleyana]
MNNLQMNISLNEIETEQVYNQIEAFLLAHGIETQQRFQIILCILESVNNVIQHCPDSAGTISVMLQNQQDNIVIDILDNTDFVKLSAPKKCPPVDKPNGRGLWIMEQWMDQVQKQATVLGTHLRLSLQKV